jgi:IS5 family transposase
VTDAKGLKHICPRSGAVLGDKGYCTKPAQTTLLKNNCHDMTIKTKNMKVKNKEKDRWISGCRSPYERVFSKTSNRARYCGIAKNQFQIFMQAFAHNLKRLVVLEVEDIQLTPV